MPRPWRFAPLDASLVKHLSGSLKISPLMAQVLTARGYETPESATAFLKTSLSDLHEPDLLPGVPEAATRIVEAIANQRPIKIYGDYDVDGVTSTTLLWHCLKLAGAAVDFYIPDRRAEGYGLNEDAIRKFHAENPRQLVISVDCGITAVKEAALAKQLGLELIITDHHEPPAELPAACLVHPRLPGSKYPYGWLCGVGVAFKLAWAICQRLGDGKKASPRMKEFLTSAVTLTAIGTIADVVPLTGENRVIVRFGLANLAQKSSVGLRTLLQEVGLGDQQVLKAADVGFKLAPPINAAGRLQQARLGVELLTTEDTHRAKMLAAHLVHLNQERKTIETRIMKQAKEMVAENPAWQDHGALVLAHDKWHPGVIGIVANRVAEHFEKPTFLIALDGSTQTGSGSGRSFAGCNLYEALCNCAAELISFGGHHAAAGLKIRADKIDCFREELQKYTSVHHEVTEDDLELKVDAEVRLADVTVPAVNELSRLGPFGQENPEPLFVATNVNLAQPPKRIGKEENHLSLTLQQHQTRIRAIAFGRADWADEIAAVSGPISICFAPEINEWQGRRSVDLHIKDWKPAGGK